MDHTIVGRYDVASVEHNGADCDVRRFVDGRRSPFQDYMGRNGPQKIAVNYSEGSEICDRLTDGMCLTMMNLLGNIENSDRVISAIRRVSATRERKIPTELESIRGANRHTEEIFDLTPSSRSWFVARPTLFPCLWDRQALG